MKFARSDNWIVKQLVCLRSFSLAGFVLFYSGRSPYPSSKSNNCSRHTVCSCRFLPVCLLLFFLEGEGEQEGRGGAVGGGNAILLFNREWKHAVFKLLSPNFHLNYVKAKPWNAVDQATLIDSVTFSFIGGRIRRPVKREHHATIQLVSE